MKNLIVLVSLFLSLTACRDKMNGAYQPVQKESKIKKINLLKDIDASLSYSKKAYHQGKDAGCKNYHKKRYE